MEITSYSKEFIRTCYLDLHRVRYFDEVAAELFLQGKMSGNIHTCIGQEAITVGGLHALHPDDLLVHSHRGHGQCLLKGATADLLMAELFGKKAGYCGGKGGSMHISDMDLGIIGSNGIVGAGIPIAVGSALASKCKQDGKVTLCFFGDAATNTGCFHEALNMASAWKLPVVLFIENNKYGVSVNIDRVTNLQDLSARAGAYGIEGVTIDGNDVLEVYQATQRALDKARQGEGPTLIEAKTFRQHGHFEGDPQSYKTKQEVDYWLTKDPIVNFRKAVLAAGYATEAELDDMAAQARAEMDAAAQFAMDAPYPDVADAFEDIYAMNNAACIQC